MKSIVEEALSRAEMEIDSPIYRHDQSTEADEELEKILSELKTNIAVVGCGGGGSNTIQRMMEEG
ncbi:MAG: cell division protein FtsZ, partial [Methanosarcinales archaeon]|nr:cell division protein FtsZ [Methanosarcinales archaeon]